MALLETPSRVWRRIQSLDDHDLPSLPSVPVFDHSAITESETGSEHAPDDILLPVHSTPAALSSHTATSTIRLHSSNSSTARFASSIASRSVSANHSSASRAAGRTKHDSFDVSAISSLPDVHDPVTSEEDCARSVASVPESYLPPEEDHNGLDDLSLSDALESLSRSSSPFPPELPDVQPPKTKYDYSVSLRTEPKPSPVDKFRNVALRKPFAHARTRTPSLSRTTASPASSPANSTPQSVMSIALPRSSPSSPTPDLSIPLPRSRTASPAFQHLPSVIIQPPEEDITDQMSSQEQEQLSPLEEHPSYSSEQQQFQPEKQSDSEDAQYTQDITTPDDTDEREPTFSSASSDPNKSPYQNSNTMTAMNRSPALSVAFSSPGLSSAFTPTPAIPPRPRPRFNVPRPELEVEEDEQEEQYEQGQEDEDENPLTPRTRRKSFLLSVINSTARPRMKYPTPHPHRRITGVGIAEPPDDSIATPGPNIGTALAGATPGPRPRGRMSHPLAQTYAIGEEGSDSASGEGETHTQLASPYDSGGERVSFISTASSHDLTTHVRANTSFDPVMGLGHRGVGVGRFNANKLNTYLHGLNRRLQEENEVLLQRLRKMEEENGVEGGKKYSSIFPTGSRDRRISAGSALGDVEEDVNAEGWAEEKKELEELVEQLKQEAETSTEEKEQAKRALEAERMEIEELFEQLKEDAENSAAEKEQAERVLEDARNEKAELEDFVEQLRDAVERSAGEKEHTERSLEAERHARGKLEAHVGQLEREVAKSAAEQARVERTLETEINSRGELEELVEQLKEETNKLAAEKEEAERVLNFERNERVELEELVGQLGGEVEKLTGKQEEAERALEEERNERARDKERWRERMGEVEKGVEGIVRDLERKLEEAEAKARNAEMIRTTVPDVSTPHKTVNISGISPIHRQILTMSVRAPKTPGGPLRELSWLNNTTADASVSPLLSEISRLQRELDRANESIDDKLDKLEDAGLGVVDLTKDLEGARSRIAALEEEIGELRRREELRLQRLEKLRCRKCLVKIDLSRLDISSDESSLDFSRSYMSSNPPTPPTKTSEALRSELQIVNVELSAMKQQWLDEKQQLIGENALLQSTANRLNLQVRDAKDEIKRATALEKAGQKARAGIQGELDEAQQTIAELENDLRAERSSLRQQFTEQACVQHERDELVRQLQRTEEDMKDVKRQLQHTKQENHELENELRVNANVEQKARKLEVKVTENSETIDQLRQERSLLASNYKELQRRFSKVTERANKLREDHAQSQTSHDNRRHQLDLHLLKIEDLRHALSDQGDELQRAEAEKAHTAAENVETINQLRQERSLLASNYKELQRQFSEVSERANKLREDHAQTRTSHDNRRHQLDVHLLEIKDLRLALTDQRDELQRTKAEKARIAAENIETINQLRQERSLLASNNKDLQRQFSSISERADKLREDRIQLQTSHDNRRHQLDTRLVEISDLQRTVSDQANELQRAKAEKARITAEKSDIDSTMAALEADLKRVRRDAEAFGRDLKVLREERDKLLEGQIEDGKAERAKRQAQAQIRILNEQLDAEKVKVKNVEEEWKSHVCAADNRQLEASKVQHNKDCKGLIAQIRYLKAKFTRESSLRDDLGYQKHYLLILLARFEASEQRVLVAIARIGYPKPAELPSLAKKCRSLRTVAISLIFIRRARLASEKWREESACRQAVVAALQEVRRRRTTTTNIT